MKAIERYIYIYVYKKQQLMDSTGNLLSMIEMNPDKSMTKSIEARFDHVLSFASVTLLSVDQPINFSSIKKH